MAGENVEIVKTFKYLGTVLDSKLNFSDNTDHITKKAQQRLRLLRTLSCFNVSKKALSMFYQAHICSILSFNISAWFGNLSLKNRNKLYKIFNAARKIIGNTQMPLGHIFERAILKKNGKDIKNKKKHPLNLKFILLTSQRKNKSPNTKTNRHKNSLVPLAIKIINRN